MFVVRVYIIILHCLLVSSSRIIISQINRNLILICSHLDDFFGIFINRLSCYRVEEARMVQLGFGIERSEGGGVDGVRRFGDRIDRPSRVFIESEDDRLLCFGVYHVSFVGIIEPWQDVSALRVVWPEGFFVDREGLVGLVVEGLTADWVKVGGKRLLRARMVHAQGFRVEVVGVGLFRGRVHDSAGLHFEASRQL